MEIYEGTRLNVLALDMLHHENDDILDHPRIAVISIKHQKTPKNSVLYHENYNIVLLTMQSLALPNRSAVKDTSMCSVFCYTCHSKIYLKIGLSKNSGDF